METKHKTIGLRTYSVAQLPTFKALDVFEQLSVLIGPAMTSLAASGMDGRVEPAIEALFSKMGGGKLKSLAAQLLDGVLVEENGKSAPMLTGFDLRYAGQLFEVFRVMAFVVEVNYRDFFDGAREVLAGFFRPQPADPASSSPIT